MPQIKLEFKGSLHCGGVAGVLGDKKDFTYRPNVDRILGASIQSTIDGSPILGKRAEAKISNDWAKDGEIRVHAWVDSGNDISWTVYVDAWIN